MCVYTVDKKIPIFLFWRQQTDSMDTPVNSFYQDVASLGQTIDNFQDKYKNTSLQVHHTYNYDVSMKQLDTAIKILQSISEEM